jgi:putative endonuclease
MYYVYIVTNNKKTVLYTGISNDLSKRITQHYLERGNRKTFAGTYACFNLIYFEEYKNIHSAIEREKEIKGWTRKKKEQLIAMENPGFAILNDQFVDI